MADVIHRKPSCIPLTLYAQKRFEKYASLKEVLRIETDQVGCQHRPTTFRKCSNQLQSHHSTGAKEGDPDQVLGC